MGRPLDEDIIIKILERWQKAFKENSHYVSASDLSLVIKDVRELPTIQPVATDTNVGDKISKFIDGLEETFAYIREREGGDSVCGLCEYDGAYIGESGDWCNECPGFNRDDCFKLSDETRKKWTDEIIKALPTAQPEPKEGHWIRTDCGLDVECKCSRCGYKDFVEPRDEYWFKRNYCPNCGAKMKGATT